MTTHAVGNTTTRKTSTPSKRAWEEDVQATRPNSSQSDLNKNIKEQNNAIATKRKESSGVKSMDSGVYGGEVRLKSVELGVEDSNIQSVNMARGDRSTATADNTNGELTVSVKNGSKLDKDAEKANNNEGEGADDSFVGHWKLFTRVLKSKRFDSEKLESLYQRYIFRLNQKFASWLVFILIVLCIALVVFQFSLENEGDNIEGFIMIAFLVVYLVLAVIVNRSGSSDKQMSDSSQKQLRWVSYALLTLSCGIVLVSVLCPVGSKDSRKYNSPTDGVWLTIFFIYMTYTMLPVRMRIAVFGGCLLLTIHLVASAAQNSDNPNLPRLVSDVLFLYSVSLLPSEYLHVIVVIFIPDIIFFHRS